MQTTEDHGCWLQTKLEESWRCLWGRQMHFHSVFNFFITKVGVKTSSPFPLHTVVLLRKLNESVGMVCEHQPTPVGGLPSVSPLLGYKGTEVQCSHLFGFPQLAREGLGWQFATATIASSCFLWPYNSSLTKCLPFQPCLNVIMISFLSYFFFEQIPWHISMHKWKRSVTCANRESDTDFCTTSTWSCFKASLFNDDSMTIFRNPAMVDSHDNLAT